MTVPSLRTLLSPTLRRVLRPPTPISSCIPALATGLDRRCCASFSLNPPPSSSQLNADPSLVESAHAPPDFVAESAVVYPDAISDQEGEALVRDIQGRMRRRRYEKGHWDAVITGYKEVELPISSDGAFEGVTFLSDESARVIERIRSQLEYMHFGPSGIKDDDEQVKGTPDRPLRWLPCHGIDLKADGQLNAHVDSVRYSGGIVAGLSLLSGSVMRLLPAPPGEIARSSGEGERKGENYAFADLDAATGKNLSTVAAAEEGNEGLSGHVDLYLPPLSLYVLSGVARYRYTHELLPCGTVFCGPDGEEVEVQRDRRISVMFRDAR